ncbi:hypothetical protein MLD38_025411 [Melastoma candidum]|uniref:Uncharacterized protein n=1 Tax=Melastoma candidum TaxID=119954 RepID=A0ACB9NY60_9MYRT|nr:hypothetical protein MLD38_025411 [Melastoma candidum]
MGVNLLSYNPHDPSGLESYAYKWERTHYASLFQDIYKDLANGEELTNEKDHVSISGRAFEKLAFLTLRDDFGTTQKRRLLADQFEQLQAVVNIGDIFGACGTVKRTERLSLCVNSFSIFTKSLLSLPDKHYRQSQYMVYEIGCIFRNEGIYTRHNHEFTTIEMYETYSDYQSMMNMAEETVTRCALAVQNKLTIGYQGLEISLERPWGWETMHNLVKETARIDFANWKNDLKAAKEVTLNNSREHHQKCPRR